MTKSKKSNIGIVAGNRDFTLSELEMIERLYANGEKGFVQNALSNHISYDIDFLITVLFNLKRYKDPNVFGVVPSSLDKIMSVISSPLSEYSKDVIGKLSAETQIKVIPENYYQCSMCGKILSSSNFRKSDAKQYSHIGHISFCNECVVDLAKQTYKICNDIKESIVVMCYKTDSVVVRDLVDDVADRSKDVQSMINDGTYIIDYFKRYDTFYSSPSDIYDFSNSNLNNEPFQYERVKVGKGVYDRLVSNLEGLQSSSSLTSLSHEEIKRLHDRWGDLPVEQMEWLDKRFDDWYERHNISGGKNDELVVKQLCFEEYSIMKARNEGGNSKDLEKNLKNILSLLKESNLTPKQQAKSDDNSSKTLSAYIKEFEKHKPIILRDPEFQDPDNITRLRENMAGALARTLLRPNELTQKFNTNMKEHTVSFDDKGEVD